MQKDSILPPIPLSVFNSEDSICYYFELQNNDFKKSLTHKSANLKNDNSRMVFVGMYAFKGLVAEWISKHIGGSGTQLQQYFGNITCNNYLSQLFEQWKLHKYIRYNIDINLDSLKHIFTLGLLGCIFEHSPSEKIERLILDFFIFPNDHLLPKTVYQKDIWQQFKFLCEQHEIPYPNITHEVEDGLQCFTVKVEGFEPVKCCSVSYRYAKKKAIKQAYTALLKHVETELLEDEAHIAFQDTVYTKRKKKKERIKASQVEEWEQKRDQRKEANIIKREERKRLKKQEDSHRRSQKQQIKEKKQKKKGANTIYREYSAEEIATMNPAKRRRLEDLGIIEPRKK